MAIGCSGIADRMTRRRSSLADRKAAITPRVRRHMRRGVGSCRAVSQFRTSAVASSISFCSSAVGLSGPGSRRCMKYQRNGFPTSPAACRSVTSRIAFWLVRIELISVIASSNAASNRLEARVLRCWHDRRARTLRRVDGLLGYRARNGAVSFLEAPQRAGRGADTSTRSMMSSPSGGRRRLAGCRTSSARGASARESARRVCRPRSGELSEATRRHRRPRNAITILRRRPSTIRNNKRPGDLPERLGIPRRGWRPSASELAARPCYVRAGSRAPFPADTSPLCLVVAEGSAVAESAAALSAPLPPCTPSAPE